jgi:hypothetical protein
MVRFFPSRSTRSKIPGEAVLPGEVPPLVVLHAGSGVVAVTDAVDGEDDFGVLWIFFDQLAQFGDVLIEGAAVGLASRRAEYLRW